MRSCGRNEDGAQLLVHHILLCSAFSCLCDNLSLLPPGRAVGWGGSATVGKGEVYFAVLFLLPFPDLHVAEVNVIPKDVAQ